MEEQAGFPPLNPRTKAPRYNIIAMSTPVDTTADARGSLPKIEFRIPPRRAPRHGGRGVCDRVARMYAGGPHQGDDLVAVRSGQLAVSFFYSPSLSPRASTLNRRTVALETRDGVPLIGDPCGNPKEQDSISQRLGHSAALCGGCAEP